MIWDTPTQAIESASTSMNSSKLPRTAKMVQWERGTVNADIGGGRFDNFTAFLLGKGVANFIFDPFNRSKEFNDLSVANIQDGQADTVTVSNTLNVIKEGYIRQVVISQAANALKEDGTAYFLIYAGDGSGVGRVSKTVGGEAKSWQENRRAGDYISEIEQQFACVTVRGNLVSASKPTKGK